MSHGCQDVSRMEPLPYAPGLLRPRMSSDPCLTMWVNESASSCWLKRHTLPWASYAAGSRWLGVVSKGWFWSGTEMPPPPDSSLTLNKGSSQLTDCELL